MRKTDTLAENMLHLEPMAFMQEARNGWGQLEQTILLKEVTLQGKAFSKYVHPVNDSRLSGFGSRVQEPKRIGQPPVLLRGYAQTFPGQLGNGHP